MTSPATAAGAAAGTGGQGTGSQDGGVQPGSGSTATGQGGATQGGQQGSQTGGQPAAGGKGSDDGLYAEYLKNVPTQLHGTVTDAFRKWDANVTQRQQEVRSQLAAFQPLIDQGADPQQLQAAHQMLTWLQEDPAEGLQLIAAELGVDLGQLGVGDGGQGQQQPGGMPGGMGDEGLQAGQGDPNGEAPPQWFAQFQEQYGQLEQLVQLMAQERVSQHQNQQTEQQIDQMEQALQAAGVPLEEGDPQLKYVLGQLAMAEDDSVPLEQVVSAAVQDWQQMRTQLGGQNAAATTPTVLSAGGGMPTQQVDPATLSQRDRRALAVQRAMELKASSG